jgi:predicted nuclease of predicted toxin-antitoxin system
VKFIIDECLSHFLARDFADRGYPDCVQPIHVGLRGAHDHTIVARALAEDRIIVTSNARDFRRLLGKTPLHPRAIIIHAQERRLAWHLILAALAFIELQARPEDFMVNRVVEASVTDGIRPYELPLDGS